MRASVSFCLFPSVPLHCLDKRIACFGGAALLVLSAAMSPIASAQTSGASSIDATGDSKSEMAACARGDTPQSRQTCITEVRRAQAARRAGKLENYGGKFAANALKRCEVFKTSDDRAACQARVEKAAMDGSVAEGGVLREVQVTVTPPATTGTETMPMPTPMPDMPMPDMPAPMPMPSVPQ